MSAPAPDALPPPPLPRRIRFAAVVCLVLSGLTGLFALSEMMSLGPLSELRESNQPRLLMLGDPVVTQRAFEAQLAVFTSLQES